MDGSIDWGFYFIWSCLLVFAISSVWYFVFYGRVSLLGSKDPRRALQALGLSAVCLVRGARLLRLLLGCLGNENITRVLLWGDCGSCTECHSLPVAGTTS